MRLTAIVQILIISTIALSSQAWAVDLVRKATLEVDGKEYTFPIGKDDRKEEVYLLLKAAEGDKLALKLFMQGQDERLFFIGDDIPTWVRVHSNGKMEVL